MKKILLLYTVAGAIGLSSLAIKKTLYKSAVASAIPAVIITAPNAHWSASSTGTFNFKKICLPLNGQPILTQAQFKKNGTFYFVFSKMNASEQLQTETSIEGEVLFIKTGKGRNSFVTTAAKGTCKEIKDNKSIIHPVPGKELEILYSGSWLWEKISFPDIPSEDFLLLVDLKAHPEAADALPGNIDKSWVSKFYIRK